MTSKKASLKSKYVDLCGVRCWPTPNRAVVHRLEFVHGTNALDCSYLEIVTIRRRTNLFFLPDDFICSLLALKTVALTSSTSFSSTKKRWIAAGLALLDAMTVSS